MHQRAMMKRKGNGKRRRAKGGRGVKYTGLRQKEEEGEMYAVVKAVLGGDTARVACQDGEERICIIRAKFRGRRRHQNRLSPGCWVLVGVRLWEGAASGKRKCDLLCLYSPEEVSRLKKMETSDPQGINNAYLEKAWRAASCLEGVPATAEGAGGAAAEVDCVFDESAGDSLAPDRVAVAYPPSQQADNEHFGLGEEDIDLDEI